MSDSVASAASSALDDLLDVSPQVDAAVILERSSGRLVSSAESSGRSGPRSEGSSATGRVADRFGEIAMRLLEAADQSRVELGREPVSQVEVATADGHVFVVADGSHVVAAVTEADPTVGLVFYDLKTALRAVREAAEAGPASDVVVPMPDQGSPDGDGPNGSASPAGGEEGSGRWRRGKS